MSEGRRTYTVVLMREEEGGYSVSVPALKGCHTQGDTLAEALLMAEDAMRLYLEVLEEDGRPIPPGDWGRGWMRARSLRRWHTD